MARYKVVKAFCLGAGKDVAPGDEIQVPSSDMTVHRAKLKARDGWLEEIIPKPEPAAEDEDEDADEPETEPPEPETEPPETETEPEPAAPGKDRASAPPRRRGPGRPRGSGK